MAILSAPANASACPLWNVAIPLNCHPPAIRHVRMLEMSTDHVQAGEQELGPEPLLGRMTRTAEEHNGPVGACQPQRFLKDGLVAGDVEDDSRPFPVRQRQHVKPRPSSVTG